MKKYLPFFLFITEFSFAQNSFVKQWDYRFGGNDYEIISGFQKTSDGGYILTGESSSGISGDKTQDSWGDRDYWVVKIDLFGMKQWDKRYGGTSSDIPLAVKETSDHGYILGGYSSSGVNGDKTESSWGLSDYWIVKIDSLGIKLWEKRYGGSENDLCTDIEQTFDGGYILGGYTSSGISGDKTQANWDTVGGSDIWIVKTDSVGNKQWDKRFGGCGSPGYGNDRFSKLYQVSDGGYILAGYSDSPVSGDKSQPSWGNSYDYWIIRTDSSGNKLWDKRYGGTSSDELYSMNKTADGGYILGGTSQSTNSGDKTAQSWGLSDYWIVKIDSLGNQEWDQDFGGMGNDEDVGTIIQTVDGGYIMSGSSYSPISGSKTENNLGLEQTWIVKMNSSGIKEWDKTIFTQGHDEESYIVQSSEGCYVVANWTSADTGGYKSQHNWDLNFFTPDFWILKFCMPSNSSLFFASDTLLCEKFCINFFDSSSNNPTSWLWQFPGGSPSFSTDQNPTNICYNLPGTYDVTLITTTANGNDTLTFPNYITVYPTPPFPTITQVGYTLTSTPANAYQWQLNSTDIPGATNQSYAVLQTGYYTVVVGDSNGCKNSATTYVLISGVDDINIDAGISISPNPSDGNFRVEAFNTSFGGNVSIDVVNTVGQVIFSATEKVSVSGFSKEVNLSHAVHGVYFIEVKTQHQSVKKMILIE